MMFAFICLISIFVITVHAQKWALASNSCTFTDKMLAIKAGETFTYTDCNVDVNTIASFGIDQPWIKNTDGSDYQVEILIDDVSRQSLSETGDVSQVVIVDHGRWKLAIKCLNQFTDCDLELDFWLGDVCLRYPDTFSNNEFVQRQCAASTTTIATQSTVAPTTRDPNAPPPTTGPARLCPNGSTPQTCEINPCAGSTCDSAKLGSTCVVDDCNGCVAKWIDPQGNPLNCDDKSAWLQEESSCIIINPTPISIDTARNFTCGNKRTTALAAIIQGGPWLQRDGTPTYDLNIYVNGVKRQGGVGFTNLEKDMSQLVVLDEGQWTVEVICRNRFKSCKFTTNMWFGDVCLRYKSSMPFNPDIQTRCTPSPTPLPTPAPTPMPTPAPTPAPTPPTTRGVDEPPVTTADFTGPTTTIDPALLCPDEETIREECAFSNACDITDCPAQDEAAGDVCTLDGCEGCIPVWTAVDGNRVVCFINTVATLLNATDIDSAEVPYRFTMNDIESPAYFTVDLDMAAMLNFEIVLAQGVDKAEMLVRKDDFPVRTTASWTSHPKDGEPDGTFNWEDDIPWKLSAGVTGRWHITVIPLVNETVSAAIVVREAVLKDNGATLLQLSMISMIVAFMSFF